MLTRLSQFLSPSSARCSSSNETFFLGLCELVAGAPIRRDPFAVTKRTRIGSLSRYLRLEDFNTFHNPRHPNFQECIHALVRYSVGEHLVLQSSGVQLASQVPRKLDYAFSKEGREWSSGNTLTCLI